MEDTQTISEYLTLRARRCPGQAAVICAAGSLDYEQLEDRSNVCALGLRRAGIQPGMRTVLMVPPSMEFLILAFGLIKAEAVLVAVDPGIGWRQLGLCLEEAAPEAFVGVSRAHAARVLLGWAKPTLKKHVTVGHRWFWGGWTFPQIMQPLGGPERREKTRRESTGPHPDAMAAIAFTSGSTGVPKGVVYTHRMFSAQAALLQDHFGIQQGEVDLATFPLFALFDAAWGATTVFPEMDFTRPAKVDPQEIIRQIQNHEVTHMFGSPALLDRVGRHCQHCGVRFPSLKRVLSAGAPVPSEVLERFATTLPQGVEVFTPYGATEALPVCSIGHRERLVSEQSEDLTGICVGRPLKGVGLAVIQITENSIEKWADSWKLPPGEIGELVVWGDNVSTRYHQRAEANRMSKILRADGTVCHRMGDLGYLDRQGRVWFCGRKSQRVISSGETLYTVPCEKVFNAHPAVFRTALVGVGTWPMQRPVLCVELADRRRWRGSERLRKELLELALNHRGTRKIQTVLFHRRFPVDIRHNSKIFREKLAVWAGRKLGRSKPDSKEKS